MEDWPSGDTIAATAPRFFVLGPVASHRDGEALPLGAPKKRSVLAVLLLHANRVVAKERLFDLVWGEEQPPSVEMRLRVYVSELRSMLGHHTIERRGGGYLLHVGPGELDLQIFTDTVEAARTDLAERRLDAACQRLRTALSLWQGPALGGACEVLAGHHQAGLEELRLAALEDLFEAELARGPHTEMIGELRRLTFRHPFRTRLTAQLMLALHQAGRDAEALDVYAQARQKHVDELGIEPAAELHSVQLRILNGSGEVSVPPSRPSSPAVAAGNLPAEAPGFVGGDGPIEQTRRLLAVSRSVTLTGVGGVGKTRVAIRAAHTVRHLYPGGVWFADLTRLPRAAGLSSVEQATAEALGASRSVPNFRDALIGRLRDRCCLLILDGCEHLVREVGALVSDLLRAVPDLRVLVTSRELLGSAGEHVLQVSPLRLPDPGEVGGEALELLRKCAERLGRPIPRCGDSAAMELCRQLDGIPLAIELAAGQLNMVSVEDLLNRPDDQFQPGPGGDQPTLARSHSLWHAMEWSYRLCADHEQLLWERLSVFPEPFDLTAAELVCSGNEINADEVLDLLTGLIGKSLLIAESRGAGTRYTQLDTLRQYGKKMLIERGEAALFHRRYRDYYRLEYS